MSKVTELILHIGVSEGIESLEQIEKLEKDSKPLNLVSFESSKLPKYWYGGNKVMSSNLYFGVFNHLNIQDLVGQLRRIKWEYPEDVQIVYKEQTDHKFKILDVFTQGNVQ